MSYGNRAGHANNLLASDTGRVPKGPVYMRLHYRSAVTWPGVGQLVQAHDRATFCASERPHTDIQTARRGVLSRGEPPHPPDGRGPPPQLSRICSRGRTTAQRQPAAPSASPLRDAASRRVPPSAGELPRGPRPGGDAQGQDAAADGELAPEVTTRSRRYAHAARGDAIHTWQLPIPSAPA